MDAEKRVKLHIGELTVTIHAQQAQIEELQAKVKELQHVHNGNGEAPQATS